MVAASAAIASIRQPSPATAYTLWSNRSHPALLNAAACRRPAMAMPTLVAMPVPSGPVVHSMPAVHRYSGWPGHWSPVGGICGCPPTALRLHRALRNEGLTAFTPVGCTIAHSIDAWPADNTNRSRLDQIGGTGSNRRNRCHRAQDTGAGSMGVPGCAEFAAYTASNHRVRMVLTATCSIGWSASVVGGVVVRVIVTPKVRLSRAVSSRWLEREEHRVPASHQRSPAGSA